jgi:hypothetical protein
MISHASSLIVPPGEGSVKRLHGLAFPGRTKREKTIEIPVKSTTFHPCVSRTLLVLSPGASPSEGLFFKPALLVWSRFKGKFLKGVGARKKYLG